MYGIFTYIWLIFHVNNLGMTATSPKNYTLNKPKAPSPDQKMEETTSSTLKKSARNWSGILFGTVSYPLQIRGTGIFAYI